MANLKISELSALAGGDLVAADELAIVDDSASETKKITVSNLIANGVTLISDDSIPGAKILFAAGDIATAALADSAVTTVKIADDGVTGAKLADESTVDLVTTLPASGAFTGQLALDTDDNKLYLWNGTSWLSVAAAGSVNTVSGSTTGEVNIVSTVSGDTVTISATLDDTTAASQFLAGPTGSAGAVGYRAIDGNDLPVATTSAKGGVIVNGEGLRMDSNTIEVDNDVTASSTHHVVTYNAKGLVTGGRIIASSDLPIATTSARGAVIASDGLAVDASGNLSIDNTVTSGTYTKVTVTAQGVVSAGETLTADDIPNHSAAKLTSGTIGSSIIANDAVTASKLADQSITKFGGALGSDNVTIFPQGDFKGQFFYDETTQDLYIYTGSSFVPVTVLSGNLVNAGVYDASTNQMSSVTSAGSAAGFSVGAALPNPAGTNLNHYVVVGVSGTGSGAAPAVALAPPDMLLSQGVGSQYSLIDVSNAIAGQTASNISLITTGNITATDVQAGIQELDTEKLQKSGDTMTGALGIGTASSIVFEGSTADDYETTLTVTDPTADHTITLPDVTGTVVTTGDTGSVTSTMITDGTIVNADINASAEIAVSKLANGTARQLLQTDSGGTGVEFTSNVDVPGTLDVTNAAVFDSTITAAGLITANGKVSFSAGTAAAPSLYSGSDEDTGIYSPGSDQIALATNGTGRLFIDSSGRVGIGTSSPARELTVNGDINLGNNNKIEGGSSGGSLQIQGGSTFPGGNILLGGGSGDDGIQFRTSGASQTSTERMRIDSSGNVGVGTSSPDRALTVNSSSSNINYVRLRETTVNTPTDGGSFIELGGTRSSGNYGFYGGIFGGRSNQAANNSGYLAFYADNSDGNSLTERMRIDSSGNVGIGTTSPNAPLDVNGVIHARSSISFRSGATVGGSIVTTAAGRLKIGSYNATGADHGEITFTRNNTAGDLESARIDSSGRLLVGTSTSVATSVGQPPIQVTTGQSIIRYSSTGSFPAVLDICHSKSNTIGTNTSLGDGDAIGRISYGGADGSSYVVAAEVEAFVDGTPGTNDMPGRLVFSTTADGASSPTERMRIASDGSVLVGTTSAPNSETFAVSGSAAIEGLNGSILVTVFQNAAATVTYTLRSRETGMMIITYAPSSTQTDWGTSGDGLYRTIYFGNLANARAKIIGHDAGRTSTTRDGAITTSVSGNNVIISKSAGSGINEGDLSIAIISAHRIRQPVVT